MFTKDKAKDGGLASQSELLAEIERFKKHTKSIHGEFVDYDRHGTWTFKVSHV